MTGTVLVIFPKLALLTAIRLSPGVVPGMSNEDFVAAAEAAKDGCPISQALKGNVALSVDAALEG